MNITDEMVEKALAAANGAMVDTRRHWTDGDKAAVRATLETVAQSESTPMLPELCKALGWQGGTIHQAVEQVARMHAALKEITRGAGPFNRDPLKHADNCIEAMKAVATGALEGDWNPDE